MFLGIYVLVAVVWFLFGGIAFVLEVTGAYLDEDAAKTIARWTLAGLVWPLAIVFGVLVVLVGLLRYAGVIDALENFQNKYQVYLGFSKSWRKDV